MFHSTPRFARWSASAALLAAGALLAACGSTDSTGPGGNGSLAPCPGNATPTAVTLPVGGVAAIGDPAALSCLSLAGSGGGGGTFVVVAANASTTPDQIGTFAMADTLGGAVAALHARLAGATGAPPMPLLLPNTAAEARIREAERRLFAEPARVSAASALLSASRVGAPVSRASVPAVGDTLAFNVPDPNASNACTSFTNVHAVVKAVGTHGIILQDVKAPSGGFTSTDFSSIVNEFDSQIYAADTVHFGSPSDIDQNGHVYLLFSPEVNKATPRNSKGILEGFFFGGDLFPTSSCSESNLTEIFYLLVPDPTGTFSDARTVSDVRQGTRGTIAHEFQHMINEGVRIKENAPDETIWLNEALSHFAEELVGRWEHGYGDMQSLSIGDVADQANNYADFNAFFGQNIGRFQLFLQDPNTLGATSVHADTSLAVRGAAWALVRWSADHYSGGNVPAFTRALVAGPDTGVANLTARAGVPFDTLMAGWMVANFADDAGIPGLPSQDTFLSWNMRSVEDAISSGAYPLVPIALSSGQAKRDSVASAGGVYFQVAAPGTRPTLIGELTPKGGAVSYPGARLYIVRVQ